jgi:hypothetical protein
MPRRSSLGWFSRNTQPSRFVPIIALRSHGRKSLQLAFLAQPRFLVANG